MNVDDSNDNNQSSSKTVLSKYFINKHGMDESLSEFQEAKNHLSGPKTKVRSKKLRKIKVQKDIRKVLKSKNELISYTEKFDNVCKKSGIDVDSEQLQLAIALSKSLQKSEHQISIPESSQLLKSHEHINKIRTTLQEYGFKVLKTTNKKHPKKYKKQYKLLNVTEAERNQIISDKYSQILHEYLNYGNINDQFTVDINTPIYDLATNTDYQLMRNNNIFYVQDLVEKSLTCYCMLKNWADIPGRPSSPIPEKPTIMNFSDVKCSQDELDIILSGSLKASHNIFKLKTDAIDYNKQTDNNIKNEDVIEILDKKPMVLSIPKQTRCYSPDIFDDESTVLETTKIISLSQEPRTLQGNSVFMDLTECVNEIPNVSDNINLDIKISQGTQKSDDTKRKSNDFMEITECVGSSQPIFKCEIDLTQNSDSDDKDSHFEGEKHEAVENIDVTQSSNTSDELPSIQFNGQVGSLDNTINLNDNEIAAVLNKSKILIPCHNVVLNLSDSESNSDNSASIAEFIHEHSNEREEIDKNKKINCIQNTDKQENIDLTQSSESSIELNNIMSSPEILQTSNKYNLGKNNDISIDYDEIYDEVISSNSKTTIDKSNRCNSEEQRETKIDTIENSNYEVTSDLSQNSVFEISDKELNYSVCQSKLYDVEDDNVNLGDMSIMDQFSNPPSIAHTSIHNDSVVSDKIPLPNDDSYLPIVHMSGKANIPTDNKIKSPFKNIASINISATPKTDYIVKTVHVTPMLDYDAITTPERNEELNKYGLKPLKRKRAVKILTHIYNQTHPFAEICPTEESASPSKKRKQDLNTKVSQSSPKKTVSRKTQKEEANHCLFELTNELPVLRDIECDAEDWVFQKREKAKVHSCRVPLHISFHNYVCSRRNLREAILLYEPVDIDVIHKDLVSYGHKYDPKDLLKFLDKKCITVKTADNNNRNMRS